MVMHRSQSRIVNTQGYLGIALLLLLPIAVLTVRSGAWQQGLSLYALACAGSALLVVVALVLLLLPRYTQFRPDIFKRTLFALPGALLLLSLLGNQGEIPPIHDISTDVVNPPEFVAALEQRGPDANPIKVDADVINAQLAAYPEVKTLRSDLPLEEAFANAVAVAKDMRWEIIREDLNAGVIEAVDTTRIMNFKDDVAIRVTTDEQGTLVDLRSVSRVGQSDLGANAARIGDFLTRFQSR